MMPRLVLEVLDGRAVKTRAYIETLPVTIGRDYASDLVLDDPYVCPTHVRISEADGAGLVAEDVGSVNGLHVGPGRERVERVVLRHGTELRIGRTIIRCCDPAQPIPPTLVEADRAGMPAWLTSPVGRAGTIGGSLVVLALFAYAGSIERTGLAKAVSEAAGMLMLLALWAGVWALATRVASHRFAFTRHLAFASVMAVAVWTFGALIEWIDFFAPSGVPAGVFALPAGVALVILLVDGHLGIASGLTRWQRLRAALATTGVIAVLVLLFSLVDTDDFTNQMSYEGQLKPVPASIIPAMSVGRFAAEAQSLRAKVDQMASDSASAAGQ
jgi:hypothetical protein